MSAERMTYRERRMARAERLEEWSEKNRERADARLSQVRAERDLIPIGQPILVGHHSEGRHRGHLARMRRSEEIGMEQAARARSQESRAAEIRRQADRAVYSDDVDAVERLVERIAGLEAEKAARDAGVKAYNRSVKAGAPDPSVLPDGLREDLGKPHLHSLLLRPDGSFRPGQSKNLAANINRLRKRLRELEAAS